MRVLVTGANGFLGSWLLRRLIEQGDEVSVLLRDGTPSATLEKKGIKVFRGDVTEPSSLTEAVRGQGQIYHLAGLIAYNRAQEPAMFRVNVAGTENILQAASLAQVQRFLLVSSVVAVGATFKPEILNEQSTFNLGQYHLGYHESKRRAEHLVQAAVRNNRIDGVIVNPSTVYGAGDAAKSTRSTQLSVARGKMFSYPPGGVSVAAVEDVVDGMVRAMNKGRSGERYILAGENLSLREVFNCIADEAGVAHPWLPVPGWVLRGLAALDEGLTPLGLRGPLPSERAMVAMMYHWYDSTKARMELGYSTRPAREAIAASVRWMSEQGLLEKK